MESSGGPVRITCLVSTWRGWKHCDAEAEPRSANPRETGPDNAGRRYGPILKAALSAALLALQAPPLARKWGAYES